MPDWPLQLYEQLLEIKLQLHRLSWRVMSDKLAWMAGR